MKKLKELFELLNKEFPTSPNARHSLTLQPASLCGETRLVLALSFPTQDSHWLFERFVLDEVDLGKTNEQLVLDIKKVRDGVAQLKAAKV
jgi:hypothetical protein